MKGRVVDIKRLMVHDGPGIRTTVFLKGCPLRCRWCHNPESVRAEPEIGFRRTACVGCGACATVCPSGAHVFDAGAHVFDRAKCTACGRCVDVCPARALEYFGRDLEVDAVVNAVLDDQTFYQQSGGGCTLSGGEPLGQPEFCAAVLESLRRQGVHCAIDTSGMAPWRAFETVLPHTDLWLYDVKHADSATHGRHTGVDSELPLANLRRLSGFGVPIEVRIPLIPGFNDDTRSLTDIGAVLRGLPNITGTRLLPYHLAHSKYAIVGHPDTMPQTAPPASPQITAAVACLRECGTKIINDV